MMSAKEAKILIVDDYPMMRVAMRSLVVESQAPWGCCGEAGTVREALKAFEDTNPDLVLLDYYLGAEDCFDLVKEVRRLSATTKILIFSCSAEISMIVRVLRAGADSYVIKEASVDEVEEAIELTLRGENYLSPSIAGQVLKRMLSKDTDEEEADVDRLTDREFQVLQLLGGGKGNREIAAQLGLSPKTIETYREKLKSKLGLADSQQLLIFAARHHDGAGESQTSFFRRDKTTGKRGKAKAVQGRRATSRA